MSTRGTRISMLGCVAALLMVAAPLAAQTDPATGTQETSPSVVDAAQVVDAWSPDAAAPSQAVGVSEAELYYRRGVELYKQDLYREALTEFNRALALEPDHAEARKFQEKANAQLQQSLVGMGAAAAPAFDAIDPETIRQQGETVQLSSDEIRRERIEKLLSDAVRYMEAGRFPVAVEIYSSVLLIDPTNPTAKEGLHKATIAAHKQDIENSGKGVNEDRAMIQNFIESSKRLPEGADARGIKPYRFSVPQIEEETVQEKEKTEMEKLLESPVSIEFEDIHINEIATFISDSWDVNIVIDNRAVEPPVKPQPQQQTPGAAAPGAFPGAPGAAPFPGGVPMAPQPVYGAPQFGAPQQPQGLRGAGVPGQPGFQAAGQYGPGQDTTYGTKSSGVVPYINLKNVSLREALQALLRPLGLDYSVQPGFIWISKPDIIRRESFEKIETRYYELRNAGSETLFKLVLRNRFGGVAG
ncbi:MAG: tetratricopeptide repeat protein, partial [Candidatus Hydrogenedens sp.]|nr:tetratricopeptide repeat protein [Candidatus Hydrogenedens sp.]